MDQPGEVTLELELRNRLGALQHQAEFKLQVKSERDKHKETFVSDIDGSVQYSAVTPPLTESPERPGMILTLHGAAVEATNQAFAYEPKDWAYVLAPTKSSPIRI